MRAVTTNTIRLPRATRARRILLVLLCIVACDVGAARPTGIAVATAHPLATEAGLEILKTGGNAFDAAIAVTAALAVVEPYSSGIGGGGFWLLHQEESDRDVMIDGRERAPGAARRDMYLDADGNVIPAASINGPLAAAIPGVPAALDHLARHYGKLPLRTSLGPAIRYARDGFAVDEHYQRMARFRLEALRRSPAAATIFLDGGAVPPVDHVIKQTDLGRTIAQIAASGAAGFYSGELARQLIDGVRDAGGIWTLDDLSAYKVVERDPVRGSYRGMEIITAAPPSSGGIALLTMLNILDGFDLAAVPKVTQKHLIVEAMRRAYRDRAEYLGDPDFVHVPVAQLTHPLYAAGLRAGIRLDKATPSDLLPGAAGAPGGNHTTHFSILDRDGNRVAATLSINTPFGSAFVPPGTGILLNNEMDDFSAKRDVPNVYGLVGAEANAIAPGKRPLSSMTPTFLENDRGIAILGTPGGSRIITMVLLAALDYADGGDPASMVEKRRFHHQYLPDVVQYEPGALTDDEANGLTALGHRLGPLDNAYGNMHAIVWDRRSGKVSAASDPRGGGSAAVAR